MVNISDRTRKNPYILDKRNCEYEYKSLSDTIDFKLCQLNGNYSRGQLIKIKTAIEDLNKLRRECVKEDIFVGHIDEEIKRLSKFRPTDKLKVDTKYQEMIMGIIDSINQNRRRKYPLKRNNGWEKKRECNDPKIYVSEWKHEDTVVRYCD